MAVLIRRPEEQDEVAAFDCGDEALNNYLNRHAWANQQKSSIGGECYVNRILRKMVVTRIRYGYRKLTVMLRREGWLESTERVYWLYGEEVLQVRTKKRVKSAAQVCCIARSRGQSSSPST